MSLFFFFFKQKTAYEMRISDWSSDVCSSDLLPGVIARLVNSHGPVRVKLVEERVPVLIRALQAGELDALITTFPMQMLDADAGALEYVKLFEIGSASCRERVCQYV